jgi:phospholipid/cholesterol/gamma-HCH transport system substrate-binding protein
MKHSLLETFIGAFVLIVALVFLLYSYSAGNQRAGGMTSGSYSLMAEFDNIGGLKIGDNVMISGVKVGSVEDIDLDDKLYRARVTFSVTNEVKLAKDSSARISSESLLGGRFLDIQPGGDENDMRSGDKIQMTQSATNLEDLLGRFIFNAKDTGKTGSDAGAEDMPAEDMPDMPDAGSDDANTDAP